MPRPATPRRSARLAVLLLGHNAELGHNGGMTKLPYWARSGRSKAPQAERVCVTDRSSNSSTVPSVARKQPCKYPRFGEEMARPKGFEALYINQ